MIGRNWVSSDLSQEDNYFLADFIERALPEDAITAPEKDDAEDYLSSFIDRVNELKPDLEAKAEQEISLGNVEMLYSRFINTFSQLDFSSKIGIIRLSTVHIPASGMRVYTPETTLICYVLSGMGDVFIDGKVLHCRKYDCICLDCEKIPSFYSRGSEKWECAFIRVNGEFNSDIFPNLCNKIRQDSIVFLTFGAGERFRSIIWDLLSARTAKHINSESLFNHLLLGMFIELDMAITRAEEKPVIIPDVIIAVQNYLDKHFPEDINLDLLAETFNISKFHLSREFKKSIGKSPIDYLIDVRINKAKSLLNDTHKSVNQISELVGIPNANHFLYLFKNREGITPSAFRKFRL